MTEYLLVGARGWDHDEWSGAFYAEDLPAQWRFCYYSNVIRSVLVPARTWERAGRREIESWIEDCDEAFRFVHEIPRDLSRPGPLPGMEGALAEFLRTIEPLGPLTAALLLRPPPKAAPDPDWLARLLALAGPHYPLSVELPHGPWRRPEVMDLVADAGAGLCWHPDRDPPPAEHGRFMVALMEEGDLKALRGVVETLGGWMGENRGTALFFEGLEAAPRLAREARIIAELLGI